jgi:hypothetical protein
MEGFCFANSRRWQIAGVHLMRPGSSRLPIRSSGRIGGVVCTRACAAGRRRRWVRRAALPG